MSPTQDIRLETGMIPTLRLITDLDSTLSYHCSLCHFFRGANDEHCRHKQRSRTQSRQPPSQHSDDSFYSARTSGSADSRALATSVKARRKAVHRPESPSPALRHKPSPTQTSLRDLRQQQSQVAAARRRVSDERLQQLYEAQILAYLVGPCVSLDRVRE